MIINFFVPDDESTFGMISALPSVFLLAFIFYTKPILEGLILASLLAFCELTPPPTKLIGVHSQISPCFGI
jgi:hypothetical protein